VSIRRPFVRDRARVSVVVVVLAAVAAAAQPLGPVRAQSRTASGGQTVDAAVRAILENPGFARASAFLDGDYDRFVRELVALTEIPAPPFKEAARAAAYLDMLKDVGLAEVQMDAEGNVMGVRKGTGGGRTLAVLAHLDTVFPEGTDVKVRREGTKLMAPGVGDDTRGLALLLQLVRALDAGGFHTASDILFVGNVGEEGEGDLRGAKFLLRRGRYKDRIGQFISIDGGGQGAITDGAVGSRRYRVSFNGPGGHSYGAFGLVNPAYAMGAAITRLSAVQVPSMPKTTFNVGAVRGGTSVNAIPAAVSMDVDLRSESCAELRKLETAFLGIVREAVAGENAARSTREGAITADPALIGDRPCGRTARSAPLVQQAAAVVRAFGLTPAYRTGSTDANVPMSLGIPAITIGSGESGGRAHAPDEWTDVRPEAVKAAAQVALAIVLAAAGVH
jgi:acetylornithine deacetylase/succinyl-diaminopimelate desuccinylase-like protein